MGVVAISDDAFFDHQRAYLQPSIERVWGHFQEVYITKMLAWDLRLTLGGDGRVDTPGHCAKFGTYTTLDLDMQMIQEEIFVWLITPQGKNTTTQAVWCTK